MVKAYTQDHVYHHPWERVTSACFRKFTDGAARRLLPHVLSVDTLFRRLDPSTGRLLTLRSLSVHAPGPAWLLRRISSSAADACLCLEASLVDPAARTMVVSTRNLGLRSFIQVQETSTYRPHPDKPDSWTSFHQHTSIRCLPLSSLLASVAEKVEQRCADRFLQNSAKGRDVMERICKFIESDSPAPATTGFRF